LPLPTAAILYLALGPSVLDRVELKALDPEADWLDAYLSPEAHPNQFGATWANPTYQAAITACARAHGRHVPYIARYVHENHEAEG